MTTTANASRYAPRGLEKGKPLTVRFLPEERVELMAEATRDDRSAASFTRLMALKGLALWKAEQQAAKAAN
jgi:hypothetical protein